MTEEELKAYVAECRREEESCLYTSTTLYIWLRSVRLWRSTFIAAPIILGGIGSWAVLKQLHDPFWSWVTAACSLLAGMFPALFKALELDAHVASITHTASQYKDLQSRFRQAANFAPMRSKQECLALFDKLMDQLKTAREGSVTPPERFFKAAQKKISAGDYSFGVDEKRSTG